MSENGEEAVSDKPEEDRHLRHVEKDVLISRMIRKKAHELCYEPYVKGKHAIRTQSLLIILYSKIDCNREYF